MNALVRSLTRLAQARPGAAQAHWLLRLPLALILAQNGLNKFPLSADAAAGFGLPLPLWALAAVGELAVAALLILGGLVRGSMGDLITRLAGAGLAAIVAGVIYVAYWGPLLDILMFNPLQVLLLCAGLYLALAGRGPSRPQAA